MNQPNDASPEIPAKDDLATQAELGSPAGRIENEGLQNHNGTAEAHQSSHAPAFPKIIKFESLARCGEEVWIETNGQVYRLRRTKQGKLILTK